MKMVTPWTGVVVDVPEAFVDRYKANGYTEEKAPKKQEKKVEEKPVEVVEEQPKEEAPKTKKK